jgi:predicted DNA-binding protein with PD1-like motif
MMNQHLSWVTTPAAGRIIQFKINIGANIFDAFRQVIERNNILCGIVIGSCGALQRAVFMNVKEAPQSYPISKDNQVSFECEGPMESTSLTGWFCHCEEQEMIHLHCSAARDEGGIPKLYGGHLLDAVAGPKMIITIQELLDERLFVGFDEQCKKTDLICRDI